MEVGKIGSIAEAEVEIFSSPSRIKEIRKPDPYELSLLKAIDEVFDDPNVNNLEFRIKTSTYDIIVYSDLSLTVLDLKKLEKKSGRKVTIGRGLYGWIVSFEEITYLDVLKEVTE